MNTKKTTRPLGSNIRFSDSICRFVGPTHFISLSLCQCRGIVNYNGGVSIIRGDDAIYIKMHDSFVEALSKRLVNRTVWKFHRPILRSAFALEGGSNGKLVHAHMIIAKPDDVDEEQFCNLVEEMAARNPWCMNGDYAVRIRRIDSVAEKSRSARYTTKDGFDRMSFT